jgi:hypothetical protein
MSSIPVAYARIADPYQVRRGSLAVVISRVISSVADPDPGSGAFLARGSGMGESQDPDP